MSNHTPDDENVVGILDETPSNNDNKTDKAFGVGSTYNDPAPSSWEAHSRTAAVPVGTVIEGDKVVPVTTDLPAASELDASSDTTPTGGFASQAGDEDFPRASKAGVQDCGGADTGHVHHKQFETSNSTTGDHKDSKKESLPAALLHHLVGSKKEGPSDASVDSNASRKK